jgi:5-formyltetrahydrofolate cyclo-ligase
MATSSKAELRTQYRKLRDALSPEEVAAKSAAVEKRILALEQVRTAESFFIYVSIGSEVHTRGLIDTLIARGKVVTVPLITSPGVMQAHRIANLADLEAGHFAIPAPAKSNHHGKRVDVCIAPGVAFTPTGQRLGAGGGYYDRYLAQHPARWSIGLAYELQMRETLPVTATDRAVDAIVTEERVLWVTRN